MCLPHELLPTLECINDIIVNPTIRAEVESNK